MRNVHENTRADVNLHGVKKGFADKKPKCVWARTRKRPGWKAETRGGETFNYAFDCKKIQIASE